MPIGRVYSASFDNIAVTAVQDLIGIYTASNAGAILIHEVRIGQGTSTSVGNLRIALRRLAATVTAGSGGAAFTPAKRISGDVAATTTARTNDTTPATSAGVTILIADFFNVINGFLWLPSPDDRLMIGRTDAFIVSLLGAPGSSENMSGSVVFEELF